MATDAEQTAGEAPQTEGQETQIPEALTARLDELSTQIGELRGATPFQGGVAQNVAQAQQGISEGAQAPEGEWPYDQGGQDGYPQQYWDGTQYGEQDLQQMAPQQAEQAAMQQLQQYIGSAVNQAIAPFQQRELQREAQQLEQRYPDLAKPEVAGPLVQQAQSYAHELGHPELGTNPRFIENFYLAQQARDRAAQETPADGDKGVHLEGGGAVPSGQEEDDPATAMLKAHGISI